GAWRSFTTKDGLSSDWVASLRESRDGSLWIGTINGGLDRLKDGVFTSLGGKDGLRTDRVFPIYEDGESTLWIGSWADGLHRLKNGRFSQITQKDGLFDDVIYQILEDGGGNLWMSCNKGVFRASRAELNAKADGKIDRVTCVAYGVADGMGSRECNGS